jgi:hypothetical protein
MFEIVEIIEMLRMRAISMVYRINEQNASNRPAHTKQPSNQATKHTKEQS